MTEKLVEAIVEMREEDSAHITADLIESGTDPLEILKMGRDAMKIIGKRFSDGEYFIPELIMGGQIMSKIVERVKPLIKEKQAGGGTTTLGKVVIGTVKGDIHDIGKNLVTFLLDINGFEVIDLGVDVPPAEFVKATRESGAHVVGLSGFLTLAFDGMKETVQALEEAGLRDRVKVMIGGGQIDEHIRNYAAADAYGNNAQDAVSLAKQWIGG